MSKLVVLCVDALFTTDLADTRHLPGFRKFLEHGAIYKDISCIYPTLTYPCHATIMTGCWPERHGITHNEKLDPATNNAAWYWEYDNLRVKTVFDYARAYGLSTAAVEWPVTAGGPIDYLIPEIWSLDKHTDPDDVFLPAISDEVKDIYLKYKSMLNWKENPEFDEFNVTCAEEIIRRHHPDVLFMHQSSLDHARHVYGAHAPQVQEALRLHDGWIQRILRTLEEEGELEEATLILLGDHGQLQVDYNICANVLLKEAGFLEADENGTVSQWRAYFQSCGLSAHVFVKSPQDYAPVRAILEQLHTKGYVQEIFTREEVLEQYHLDGDFAFVVEASPNYAFGNTANGQLIMGTDRSDYKFSVATHGHLPFRGEKPCFIVCGPQIEPGVHYGARLIDEAPTMLSLLGIPFDATSIDGEALL